MNTEREGGSVSFRSFGSILPLALTGNLIPPASRYRTVQEVWVGVWTPAPQYSSISSISPP
eukprot:872647-Amorphochlora_amoeboformis.AAC.2